MCKNFSCIVTRKAKAYWEFGVNAHDHLLTIYDLPELKNDRNYERVEVRPVSTGYLDEGGTWVVFCNDFNLPPIWWTAEHDRAALKACDEWRKRLYSECYIDEIRLKLSPFDIMPPEVLTDEMLMNLWKWYSSDMAKAGTVVSRKSIDEFLLYSDDKFGSHFTHTISASLVNVYASLINTDVTESKHYHEILTSITRKSSTIDNQRDYLYIFSLAYAYVSYLLKIDDDWPDIRAAANLLKIGIIPIINSDGTLFLLSNKNIVWQGTIRELWNIMRKESE